MIVPGEISIFFLLCFEFLIVPYSTLMIMPMIFRSNYNKKSFRLHSISTISTMSARRRVMFNSSPMARDALACGCLYDEYTWKWSCVCFNLILFSRKIQKKNHQREPKAKRVLINYFSFSFHLISHIHTIAKYWRIKKLSI